MTQPNTLLLDKMASPIGTILLVTDENRRLRALDFEDYQPRMLKLLRLHYGARQLIEGTADRKITNALTSYLNGDLDALGRINWTTGGTEFQRKIWNALTRIKPSTILNYGTLAAQLGIPNAARAVGHANGANPVSIVVPCHRLVGANGALTGYGGGIEHKRWLLKHEAANSSA